MLTRQLDAIETFLDKTTLQVDRKIFRLVSKITGNNRPSSYPYVSGDTFRALAKHLYDETASVGAADIKQGDVVFVSQDRFVEFIEKINPDIEHQYVLICHNGDAPQFDKNLSSLVEDEKIIHCFAQHVIDAHPKITPIPIGIENLHYHVAGVTKLFNRLRTYIEKYPPVRKNRIFFNFNEKTNLKERVPAKEYFKRHPLMETAPRFLSPRKHSRLLTHYKFVASPPGNAIESCRTWESLLVKTVPILKDFASFTSFQKIGLPVWIVKDWHELDNITEMELSKKYELFMQNANWKPLFMDYWIEQIESQQKQCRF